MSEANSGKRIPPQDRLIVALDVATVAEAKALVETLGDAVMFYKVGLQLFMAGGYFELIEWLRARGKKVFADLKFFDVPETVRSAVAQLRDRGIALTTVHGNDAILEASVEAAGEVGILAVTALTSLDRHDLESLGFQCDPEALVLSRARRALAIGCAGVVSSGLEAERLRNELGGGLLIVTPGIRPVDNVEDDQKRVMTVSGALARGADYIVVGRPIRNADSPKSKAEAVQEEIRQHFSRSEA